MINEFLTALFVVLVFIALGLLAFQFCNWLRSGKKFYVGERCWYVESENSIRYASIKCVIGRKYLIEYSYGLRIVWGYQLIKKEKENE